MTKWRTEFGPLIAGLAWITWTLGTMAKDTIQNTWSPRPHLEPSGYLDPFDPPPADRSYPVTTDEKDELLSIMPEEEWREIEQKAYAAMEPH